MAKSRPSTIRHRQAKDAARVACIVAMGGKCACGYADNRALLIIPNEKGKTPTKNFANGGPKVRTEYYNSIAGNPDSARLICANCYYCERFDRRKKGAI